MKKLIFILTLSCLLCGCGGDSSTDSGHGSARIYLSPENVNIESGRQAEISLHLNIDRRVFGVSMQIHFNPMIMEFDEETDFRLGGYFGGGELTFVHVVYPFIYVSVTRTQDEGMVSGDGELGFLTFTGSNSGTADIEIVPASIHFYDASGNEIVFDDVELGPAVITVE